MFVDAIQQMSTQVARMMNVPAYYISADQNTSMTYANVQDERRQFVSLSLAPYVHAIQDRLSMDDITARGNIVEFDVENAFLAVNSLERLAVIEKMLALGLITVEQAMEMENLSPNGNDTDAPSDQPDPEDEDEEFFTEDEEIIPDPLEPEPQVEVVVEEGEVKLLYVKNKNIIGLRDADGNVLTEPITAGEKVVYIPTLSSQKYPIIGVYVERPDGYIEVGMLSEAELNDPPKGKEKIYAKLIEAKKGQLTKFNTDINTGYLVPVGTPIVLAEGKVKQASKLTYTYSSVSQPFSWENILNKFKGFFTKTPTFDSSQAKIRIFTEKEITELKNQGFTGVIYAGAPYVLIENPTQEGTKKVAPQVIALKRKRLNANTHAEFLTPLMSFLEKYKQITKLFNDIGINEADDIADIISSSDVYLPKLIEKIKTKTGLEIKLTNDILT